jgi:hypothetical protein
MAFKFFFHINRVWLLNYDLQWGPSWISHRKENVDFAVDKLDINFYLEQEVATVQTWL